MSEKTTGYDAAAYMETPEDIATFLHEAPATNDPAFFAHALGISGRTKGMTEVPDGAGVKREALNAPTPPAARE